MVQDKTKLIYAKDIDQTKVLEKKIMVLDEPDLTFAKWGHIFRPFLTPNAKGIVTRSKERHWEKDGNFEDFIHPHTVVYPNEPLGDHIKEFLHKELNDRMHIVDEYTSHNERSHYWELLTDRFDKWNKDIKGSSLKVGDTVQVGMIIRNGIQTDIALGIDIFTKRYSCSNGAITTHQEGNISIPHVSSYESMREKFLQAIPIAVNAARKMIDYYQDSAYIKANQKLAERFYSGLRNKITETYFPPNFNIDPDIAKKEPENVAKIVKYEPKKEEKLWDVFNNFTERIWHAELFAKGKGLAFTGKRKAETALHKLLVAEIKTK